MRKFLLLTAFSFLTPTSSMEPTTKGVLRTYRSAFTLNGKELAQKQWPPLCQNIQKLNRKGSFHVLTSFQLASQAYAKQIFKKCEEASIPFFKHDISPNITQQELQDLLTKLSASPDVGAIQVQQPLPSHIDKIMAFSVLHPFKDVEGLSPYNLGQLVVGNPNLIPATPQSCIKLIQSVCPKLDGRSALVIGRSFQVGLPLSLLLTRLNATVTTAHTKTTDLKKLCSEADILISAAGVPKLFPGKWVGEGSIVIDVGTNFDPETKKMIGDIDYEKACEKASYITPVPGGVGPVTLISLFENYLKGMQQQSGSWKLVPIKNG